MGAMASQITSLTIVYSTVYSGADEKTSKLRVTGLCAGNSPVTDEFPAQLTSIAENVSIWWRHQFNCLVRTSTNVSHLTTVKCEWIKSFSSVCWKWILFISCFFHYLKGIFSSLITPSPFATPPIEHRRGRVTDCHCIHYWLFNEHVDYI